MRRSWIASLLVLAVASVLMLSACSSGKNAESSSPSENSSAPSESANNSSAPASAAQADSDPFGGWVEGLPKIEAPAGFDWKQFAGTTLNVITENTPPSSGLAANIDIFEKATGIKVNIEQVNLDVVIEKAGLDFNAHNDNYHIIYADPYQILAKQSKNFVDLNTLYSGRPGRLHTSSADGGRVYGQQGPSLCASVRQPDDGACLPQGRFREI